MKNRDTLSPYSPGSFHITRGFIWISTLIVTSIMVYFAIHLHSDGYKVPYAFLIILVTCFFTLLNLIFTTLLFCRNSLRPTFSLILNIILSILWALSLGFLGYSMRGTLTTTCDTTTWGSSTGVMVCQVYKTLFSFMAIAMAFVFFHIVIDVVARRDQVNTMFSAQYDSMNYRDEYKMYSRDESSVPVLGAATANATTTAAAIGHEDDRDAPDTRTDAYNAFGTVRRENTTTSSSPPEHMQPPQHYQDRRFQPPEHDADEYYDGVPEIPPTAGVRWASATGGPTPYSPLETRFEGHQTGYEAFRPHRTAYEDGGYGYRG